MNGSLSSSHPALVSLLTPPGRGAVATILFEGNLSLIDSFFQAANGMKMNEQKQNLVHFGHWGEEEIVTCRTGENKVEIHCHAGMSAVNRILNDLVDSGCRKISWQELRKNQVPGFQSELEWALTQSVTLKSAGLLQRQQKLFPEKIRELNELFDQSPEEHQQFIRTELERILRWGEIGLHLANPWNVVLTGRPNVGKSSLMNALMGYERSIVFDQPGTTRDVVKAQTAFEGWMVELSDTAGLREHHTGAIEATGIQRAKEQLENADCQLILLDRSVPLEEDDFRLMNQCPDAILVASKSDLPDAWGENHLKEVMAVSSQTGEGLKELIQKIIQKLVPEEPETTEVIPFTQRQIDLIHQAKSALEQKQWKRMRELLNELIR